MNQLHESMTENYRRTIVVGDVHGCFTELMQLLTKIDFSGEDLLISVGDMVDRGPGSLETARFFRDSPNALAVMGNHERKLSGAMKGTIQPAWSQMHTMTAIPDHEYGQWVEYFDSLPAVMETSHTIVTHARIDPGVPLPEQDPYHTCAVGGGAVKMLLDDSHVPLWYWEWRKASGIRKPLCIGHLKYSRIALVPECLFALDTGVAKGGVLSAVIFPAMEIVQVASGTNHHQMSYNDWMASRLDFLHPEELAIHKYLKLKQSPKPHPAEKRLIQRFEASLDVMDLQARLRKLRHYTLEAFGTVPAPGPARGDYFITLKKELGGFNHKLIHVALSDKPFNLDNFLKFFAKFSIRELMMEIDDGIAILRNRT